MAETADILSQDYQKVILPNLMAGCSMADLAHIEDVEDCWMDLHEYNVVPVTYMNSAASIKALCGQANGIVCTSSNAKEAFKWALKRGEKILFLPDQHLGRNVGKQLGIKTSDMVVWNPFKSWKREKFHLMGGNTKQEIENAKIILWEGHCSVHTRFNINQINTFRTQYPNGNVLVHPECTMEVVDEADYVGSTEFIIDTISNAEAGSVWGIGTEISLVNRLAKENPDKTVFCLDSVVCPCSTMYRIHPAYILWTLEGILNNKPTNIISVPKDTKTFSKLALERMLSVQTSS